MAKSPCNASSVKEMRRSLPEPTSNVRSGRRVAHLQGADLVAPGGVQCDFERRDAAVAAVYGDACAARRRVDHDDAVGLLEGDGRQRYVCAGLDVQDVGPRLVASELHGDAMFACQDRDGAGRLHPGRFAVDQHFGAGWLRWHGHVGPVRRKRHGHRLRSIHPFDLELNSGALVARMAHEGRLRAGGDGRLEWRLAALLAIAGDFDHGADRIDLEPHPAGQFGQFQNDRLVARCADSHAAFERLVAGGAGAHSIAALAKQVDFAQLEGEAALDG